MILAFRSNATAAMHSKLGLPYLKRQLSWQS